MWVGCRARMVVKTTNNVTHSDVLYFSEDETHRNSLGKAVVSKVFFGIYVLPFKQRPITKILGLPQYMIYIAIL